MKQLAKKLTQALTLSVFRLSRVVSIASLFLILSTAAIAANMTLVGTLYKAGVPLANITFFWERNDNNVWTVYPVRTDNGGHYSVTMPDCRDGITTEYYTRFALMGGGVSSRDQQWGGNSFFWNRCTTLLRDVGAPGNITDGSRYNAGPTSCPTQSVGGPVNVTNGNMWLKQTDYILPGSTGGIDITRTYNSGINVSGLFGNGWSSDYETKLITTPSTDNQILIQLDAGTGLVVDFVNIGSSVYESTRSGLEGRIVADGTQYVLTWKDGRIFRFSQTGLLVSKEDRNANQTSFTYDTNNNLTGITDPVGRSVTITLTANGHVSQISDSTGTVATYDYDPTGTYLKTVTYADGSKFKFEYVTVGTKTYLATVKDALDNIVETHQYDSSGRAYTSEKAGGNELYTVDYSHINDTTPYSSVTDGLGRVTKYYFDGSKGRNAISKIEGSCGCGGSGSEITQYQYDSKLNLTKITDALLNETTFTYDINGNRLSQTDPLGTQNWTYNSLGEVLTYKDRVDQSTANNTVVNTFDANGNLLTTTDRLGYNTTMTYTPLGQLETVKDARNNTSTLTYDTQGRLTQVKDANNKTTDLGYDVRARVTSVTNAKNETTTFTYDLNNRPQRTTFADTNYVEHTYDLAGRRTATRDARGNSTTFGYDAAYRMTSVTDPLSHTKTYGYDLMSNLTSQTDALGNVTNLEYDDFNRLKKVIYPAAAVGATRLEENVTYDKMGNVKTRVDTAGRTTAYDYDTSNRLTKITDAASQLTQFEYNLRSQMTKVKDALNQEYIFTYDPLGRVLSQTRAGTTMSFVYDEVGNRTKRTDYNGTVTNYTYDNLNRLTQGSIGTYTYDDLSQMLTATNSNGTVSFTYDNRGRVDTTTDVYGKVLDYDYDANGNRTLMKLNGVSYTSYVYDAANRLSSQTNPSESGSVFYYYDNADRLISRYYPYWTVNSRQVKTFYEYDGMSRLTRVKDRKYNTTLFDKQYSYNVANQIASITQPSGTKTYTYDNLDRLTGVTDSVAGPVESYAYDAVGNRTSSHLSSSYTYGPFNRLTATQSASYTYDNNGAMASHTDANGTLNFSHDSDGRLGGVSNATYDLAWYNYDALGRRIYKSEQNVPTSYTYDGDNVIVSTWNGATSTYQNGPGIDNKVSVRYPNSNVSQYYLQDHLGTTTGMVTPNGSFTTSGTLDSFGNNFGDFTGREYDSFTGLYYYRARMYDPQLGRFTSEDPIGFNGGNINLYGYVKNRPTMFTDPLGLIDPSVNQDPRSYASPHAFNPSNPTMVDFYFGDGGIFTQQTFSEFITAKERANRRCKSTWTQRFTNNFYETNVALPGLGAPSILPGLGLGALTSRATAQAMNSMTILEWAKEGFYGARVGAGTLSVAETGLTVAASTVVNTVLVTSAYEGGVATGSAINATFGFTDYCPCGN